ncbi:glutathione synthetase [Marinicauda pacifica]|uniref:Glutathione synthetase n=1 Tax=Marinicauda pacifica TaxID=1133559 RepID=A0A4S2H990_9PROT|nr:glutathione synthase [Marinicauda pacifica]TGY92425.1 glutathione synthase [Marinicauda pacifica]GGE48832.1 glutathione synthetase [Marinicauda pacifica]
MLNIAFQMDPITGVNVNADSTFDIALECFTRGHAIWVYGPGDLALNGQRVSASAQKVKRLQRVQGEHVELEAPQELDLHTMDVVFLRQDPPFDMSYITSTHILEHLQPEVLVVNDPRHVRDAPEKLFVTHFEGLMPPTLITSSEKRIRAFFEAHGRDIVVKPLFGNGGAGVFRVRESTENLASLVELFAQISRDPLMAQAFVPDVTNGDKRVILVDGEPAGAINRVPAKGEVRANMHVGGQAMASELSPRDLEICAAIGPELKRRGLVFVGIDVIGNYLTEINVTSPTGIQELRRFSGIDVSAMLADWIETKRAG